MVSLRSFGGIVLVLLLSLFSIFPLLHSGFFPMHDDTQVVRVYEMGKALKDGMFPVRWVEDLGYGYGYPIFNFYSPLPYYFGGSLTLLGIDVLLATKITFAVGILLSGVFMFLFVRSFFEVTTAVVVSIIYVYFPYHAVNIYVRGDLDELFAYAFLPLVFWGLFKIAFLKVPPLSRWHLNANIKWILLASVSIGLVILSHNLSAFMLLFFILPLMVGAILFSQHKLKLILMYGVVLILGFGLSGFYSIPAIVEAKYTNILSQIGGGADYKDHFVCTDQLWDSQWGYGGSTRGCLDGMSFKIGKLNIILFVLAVALVSLRLFRLDKLSAFIRSSNIRHYELFIFSIFGFLLSVFLATEASRFIWDTVSFMAFLQYPWRFLNFTGLFMSVVIGFCLRSVLVSRTDIVKDTRQIVLRNKFIPIFAIVIVFLTIFYNTKLFNPQLFYEDRTSEFYTNENYLRWTASKISDEYMPKDFKKPRSQNEIPSSTFEITGGRGAIKEVYSRTGLIKAKVDIEELSFIKANIAYFPAWNVFVNGERIEYVTEDKLSENGKFFPDGMELWIPKGTHQIEFRFVQTPLEKIANVISLISILIMPLGIIAYGRLKHYGKETS